MAVPTHRSRICLGMIDARGRPCHGLVDLRLAATPAPGILVPGPVAQTPPPVIPVPSVAGASRIASSEHRWNDHPKTEQPDAQQLGRVHAVAENQLDPDDSCNNGRSAHETRHRQNGPVHAFG